MRTRLILWLLMSFALTPPAAAHRLNEYLQATTISLGKDSIRLHLHLTAGSDVAYKVLREIDTNGDGLISETEQRAYADLVLQGLYLTIDGLKAPLQLVYWFFPSEDEIKKGIGDIQLYLAAALVPGKFSHHLIFENHQQQPVSVYLVNCLLPEATSIRVTGQSRNYDQSLYTLDFTPSNTIQTSVTGQKDLMEKTDGRAVIKTYFFHGIRHILTGYDHLLFLCALVLGAAVQKASETIGKVIKKGDYVVFESTVYPGCTEEDCLPIIEEQSGLKVGEDFKIGYSPERINPGDKKNTLSTIIKVVSGCDAEAAEEIAQLYELIVKAGVHRASSIKVAEASKIIENTQRDVNIALMNELSIIFDRMGINTYEVLEAAGTKWNFLKFFPGLVGGHCIGVDPYYLTYKAAELGFNSRVILSGRYINDNMGNYVSKKVIQHVIAHSDNVKEAKILVMGATFKENVSDIRNSKVMDVIKTLKSYYLNVFLHDPYANSEQLEEEYGIHLTKELDNDYDVVMVSVPHADYINFGDAWFASITKEHALIADLKGTYRDKITSRKYWSL